MFILARRPSFERRNMDCLRAAKGNVRVFQKAVGVQQRPVVGHRPSHSKTSQRGSVRGCHMLIKTT